VLIRLGHSPDPDDAFMFWAIAPAAIAQNMNASSGSGLWPRRMSTERG